MRADVLIFDGRHLLWRTSDAFKDLSVQVSDGREIGTGGIYGFLSVALRVHNRYGGRVMVAWEGNRKNNFRRKLYPEYKTKENASPEQLELIYDMVEQEKRLKALLRHMGVRQYEADGGEADDVVGALAKMASSKGMSTVIYSGDSDLRQLVDKFTLAVSPGWKGVDTVYDIAKVEEKHGVAPELLPDVKALSGDSSDNIPGIRGIGAVTAAKLVTTCGDVEKVIQAASSGAEIGAAERFRQPLIEGAEDIRLYKKLTTVRTDLPLVSLAPDRDQARLIKHFMVYKFRTLVAPAELTGLMAMGE